MIDALGKSLMYVEVYFAMCFGAAPIQVKRRIRLGASCGWSIRVTILFRSRCAFSVAETSSLPTWKYTLGVSFVKVLKVSSELEL